MQAQHRTPDTRTRKPEKPYPDFPLFAHASGRWAKKIRGRFHYFGKWDDGWQAALESYKAQADDLHAGRTPRPRDNAIELRDLANHYLTSRLRKLEAGELARRTFIDYRTIVERAAGRLGKTRPVDDITAQDFTSLRAWLAKQFKSPNVLAKQVQVVRSLFKYGYDAGLLDRPVRFGPDFVKPTRKATRRAKRERGERLYTALEVKRLIADATPPMKAMILLAINCGWGNSDMSELPIKALDMDKGVADYPRPKTEAKRRAILWPETITALREAVENRPAPKDKADAGRVFITKYGKPWVRMSEKDRVIDSVSREFGKLCREVGVETNGRGFYGLRHTFRTVADELPDRPAIDLIMGHEQGDDIATHYRERIDDKRLAVIADHIHKWLFGRAMKPRKRGKRDIHI